MQVGQRAPALVEPEPVAGEQLVGHGEADVVERDVVDEPAVRPVEQRHRREARGLALGERAGEEGERQAGVDDVLDEDDVASGDRAVEVLQQPDAASRAAAAVAARARSRRARGAIGSARERSARKTALDFSGATSSGLAARVGLRDLGAELGDARRDLARPR